MTAARDLSVVDHLLRASPAPPPPVGTFEEWKEAWDLLCSRWAAPIDRALAGGLAADRPAWVFAAGYQAAIQCLLGAAATTAIAAICITEKDGPHPARIKSRLRPDAEDPAGWRLDGTKTFVSGAGEADILWVAASIGKTPQGRNLLRLVRVPSQSPGVTVVPLPPLGMLPEMPHARVRFESVPLSNDAVLPGDGYLGAVKPFRTVEDLHVTAAFLAWLFGVGRRAGWRGDIQEAILGLIVLGRSLALAPPLAPHVHVALGGLLGQLRDLQARIEPLWQDVAVTIRERWLRDRKVLAIAEGVRRKRLFAAWRHYGLRTLE